MNKSFHSEVMSSVLYKPYIKTEKVVSYLPTYERWIRIFDCYPEIHQRYYVSDKGNIYDQISNTLIHPINVGDYLGVCIQTNLIDNNGYAIWKKYYVHRLVYMCFNPVENMETLEVDHIKLGKAYKHMNTSDNLRFVTDNGNKVAAYENNLTNYNIKFTEEDARAVCEGLVKRLSSKEICEQCLHMPHNKTTISFIYNVRNGDSWKYISEQYDIPEISDSRQLFTNDQIHKFCKLFEDGKSVSDVMNEFGYTVDNIGKETYKRYRLVINNIYKKRNAKHISKHYNF